MTIDGRQIHFPYAPSIAALHLVHVLRGETFEASIFHSYVIVPQPLECRFRLELLNYFFSFLTTLSTHVLCSSG